MGVLKPLSFPLDPRVKTLKTIEALLCVICISKCKDIVPVMMDSSVKEHSELPRPIPWK